MNDYYVTVGLGDGHPLHEVVKASTVLNAVTMMRMKHPSARNIQVEGLFESKRTISRPMTSLERTTKRYKSKARCIELHESGIRNSVIAKHLGVSPTSITRWINSHKNN